jgi:hypothetical protein
MPLYGTSLHEWSQPNGNFYLLIKEAPALFAAGRALFFVSLLFLLKKVQQHNNSTTSSIDRADDA